MKDTALERQPSNVHLNSYIYLQEEIDLIFSYLVEFHLTTCKAPLRLCGHSRPLILATYKNRH